MSRDSKRNWTDGGAISKQIKTGKDASSANQIRYAQLL